MAREDTALGWLKDYSTAVKHGSLKPYSLTERKARAATRNQPWGPTGTELARLSELTFSPNDCTIVLHVVDLRLSYPPKKWRNVYKGLTVLEYLLRHGSQTCVVRARSSMLPQLDSLAINFTFVEPNGRDAGVNVRHRAQAILALLKDEPRLTAEREALGKRRGTYQGFSSFDVAAQGGPISHHTDGWQAAAQDGGHLSTPVGDQEGEQAQPGSPEYRQRDPGDAALRNAGETKGVSMEENQGYLDALKRLLELPGNRVCADCAGSGAGARPTWASINCGVFICMRCAGVHRGMGVHVSKVRSCSLDTWLPEQVEFMARTGNTLGNAYWEAKLGQGLRPMPSATLQDLEAFIRRKYVAKEFAAGVWPPATDRLADSPELLSILAACLPPERARQLLASQHAEDQRRGEEERRAAAAAAAASINLMDFDDYEPVPAGGQVASSSAGAFTSAQAIDPMRSLEEAFSLSTPQPVAQAQGGSMAPSQPATSLGSWDMGAVFAAQRQEATTAASATASAAAAQAAAAEPPKLAPYSPPWAPQPSSAAHGDYGNMQLVPAGAAFAPGFHAAGTSNGYSQHINGYAQPAASSNPFAATASSYYAQFQPAPPQQQKAKPSPPPVQRLPASPAEAKAAELISRDLLAFNLHAETVSAINPPPRYSLSHQQAPAVPLRSPR